MKVLLSAEEIQTRIAALGSQLSQDFAHVKRDKPLLIVGIMKGSFVFLADLIRQMNVPMEVEFIEVSSYGASTVSSGSVSMKRDIGASIAGRDVVLVEDIIDTGTTMDFLFSHLMAKKPRSLKLCSFLHKPSRQEKPVKIDYLGFTIEDHFVVGYGLDFDNQYRELKDLVILKE